MGEHFDADSRKGAPLSEFQFRQVRFQELELGGISRPKRQRQGDGAVIFVPNGDNLSVLTCPKLVRAHAKGKVGVDCPGETSGE